VIEAAGQILWVVGLRRAAAAPITPKTQEIVEIHAMSLA
jgi:hypothetical protein